MCLITNKQLRFNIFPRTIYKIVKPAFFGNEKLFRSYYRGFLYQLNKRYKISKKEILDSKTASENFSIDNYFKGFHAFTSLDSAEKRCRYDHPDSLIAKCRIPAFSWTVESGHFQENQILSNKIKLVKILK